MTAADDDDVPSTSSVALRPFNGDDAVEDEEEGCCDKKDSRIEVTALSVAEGFEGLGWAIAAEDPNP